jgi:hypothetical protein
VAIVMSETETKAETTVQTDKTENKEKENEETKGKDEETKGKDEETKEEGKEKDEKKTNYVALVISDLVTFFISAFSAAVIASASYDLSLVLEGKTTGDCQQIPANVNMRFDQDEYPYKVPGGKYYTFFESVIEPVKYILALIGLYKTKGDRRVNFWYRKTYGWSSDFFADMIISSWSWMRYALYVICLFIRDLYDPSENYGKSILKDTNISKALLFPSLAFWPLTLVLIIVYYVLKTLINLVKWKEGQWDWVETLSPVFFKFMKANLLLNFSAGIITTISMIAAFVGVYGCFIGAINYSIFTRFLLPAVIVICIPFAVVLFLLQFLNNIGLFYTSVYQKRKTSFGLKRGLYHFLQPMFILPVIFYKFLTYFVLWFGKYKWSIGDMSDELFITSMVYAGFFGVSLFILSPYSNLKTQSQ